jgi:hypothetical protein
MYQESFLEFLDSEQETVSSRDDALFKARSILSEKEQDRQAGLQQSLQLVIEALQADGGSILALEGADEQYRVLASSKEHCIDQVKNLDSHTIFGNLCRNKNPVLIDEFTSAKWSRLSKQARIRSFISVPLLSEKEGLLLGLVYVYTSPQGVSFSRKDLEFLQQFAKVVTLGCRESLQHNVDIRSDVLQDLLRGGSELYEAESNSFTELVEMSGSQDDAESIERVLQKITACASFKGPVRGNKKKSTCYLTQDNFNRLDQAKEESRELVSKGERNWVSKSRIINISLDLVLQDFEKNLESSFLARCLRRHSG